MKTRSTLKLLTIFTFLALISCEKKELSTSVHDVDQTGVSSLPDRPILNYVTGVDIPDIVDDIYQRTGTEIQKGAASGKISYNRASMYLDYGMEVVNEDGSKNYTFDLILDDAKETEFYSVVISQTPDGNKGEPIVIGYEMKKEDMERFYAHDMDFRYFRAKQRYYDFDSFFIDSKNKRVGKTGDCGGGGTIGSSGIGYYGNIGPGGTLSNTYHETTFNTTFSNQTHLVNYTYDITINDPTTASSNTVSATALSQAFTLSNSELPGSTRSVQIPPTIVAIGVLTNMNQSAGGTSAPCLHVIKLTKEGIKTDEYYDCSENQATQKGASASKTPCTVIYGGVAINVNLATLRINNTLGGVLNDNQLGFLSRNKMPVMSISNFLETHQTTQDKVSVIRAIEEWVKGYKVINFKPLIKYPKGSDYETRYKKLTEYLKNQLPKVADIPKIVNAIHEFTQLPLDKIKNDLKWDEGPILEIIQLDSYKLGETNSDTAGYFDKEKPDRVLIDIDYVNLVENETSDPDALIFWIGTTILHEYVHYGNYATGFQYPGEDGRLFETRVYGENVQPDRARIVLNRQL